MYTRFILLADSAHVDRDGKLHIQGIFDNINSFKFPCIQKKMTLAVQIECGEKNIGPFTPSFKLKNSSGTEIFNIILQKFKFRSIPKKGNVVRHNIYIELEDIPFHVPGPYTIYFYIDDKYLDSVIFNVNKINVLKSGARA